MGTGQVDITPLEFALWALGCIALGAVLLGFPAGVLVTLEQFVPGHRLADETEEWVRKVTER